MKRTITALAFCCSLLLSLSFFLFPPVEAKENTLLAILNLPAPPPPNPLAAGVGSPRDQKFYDKQKPPKDDAPIADLLDYWRQQSATYQDLRYQAEMTPKVRERLLNEIAKNNKLLPGLVDALRGDSRSADLIKEIYDNAGNGVFDSSERDSLKEWLTYNSPYFSDELARGADGAGDTDGYVSNQEQLLALTSVDFEKARPIIDRLYNDTSLNTSRVLARWALYKRALQTDSFGDIERYRDELKAIVEDRTALPGMRDLAMDALVSEKEWAGRDDWYFSLLSDETLAELVVNGNTYTGLTTLILVSPDDKYVDKMLELVESSNIAVRSAALKNLLLKLNSGGPEVIKVFLPWLEDPKWALNNESSRLLIVQRLSDLQIPESVPGLIKIMEERKIAIVPKGTLNANAAANAADAAANAVAAQYSSNANRDPNIPLDPKDGVEVITYPYRYSAVNALAKQKDPRAIPALRRVLSLGESYEKYSVVSALLACGGFSVAEQMDALEMSAKGVLEYLDIEDGEGPFSTAVSPAPNFGLSANATPRTFGTEELKTILAQQLTQAPEISDELARAIVARISVLDASDPGLARAYRRLILRWQNSVINLLLLNDVKLGKADSDTVLRLLSQRKDLREKQSSDVYNLRTGSPLAVGIAACMFEDQNEYYAILDAGDAETKTAMLSCARLLRSPLLVEKVAESLSSANELLVTAAERYLESEDSPAARAIVLARHPNEARIMGATSAFYVEGAPPATSEYLWALYSSLGNNFLYYGWSGSGNDDQLAAIDKQLQREVLEADDLVGVYAYERHYIRIYKDRVMFSWDEDDSRYRERPMAKDEFDEIRRYLTVNNVDELPPFLSCGGEYCNARELLMLGRAGGRRVYMNGDPADFFTGLDKYFDGLKRQKGTLKYALSREIPGLEIVLASDDVYAETVWSAPGDLRVAASDGAARKRIEARIQAFATGESAPLDENLEIRDEGPDSPPENWASLIKKRNQQAKAWYSISNGEVAGTAAQPPNAEYIPIVDGLDVPPDAERWKTRAGEIELRASEEGLYKVSRGKLTKIRPGSYRDPVISANGRWAAAAKTVSEYESNVVRIDLLTNKEYSVTIEGYGRKYPIAYIPVLNRFLIVTGVYGYEYGWDDVTPNEVDTDSLTLLDPATGALQPIAGEFRPLAQQTFRPLQSTSKPGEYWAAVNDSQKNETVVGKFETKTFGFSEVLTIPKMRFNSMNMWVDESAGKIYFVYRGHVLSLPLPK